MSADIVDRLRDDTEGPFLHYEAADVIERLRAENQELTRAGWALLNARDGEAVIAAEARWHEVTGASDD